MSLCNFVSLWKIYSCLVIPNNLHWKSCDYLYLYSLPTYMGLGMVEVVVNLADLLWHHHIEQVNRICACYSQDGRKPEHKSFTLGEDQTNATKDKVPWRDIVGLPSSGALIRDYLHCQKIRYRALSNKLIRPIRKWGWKGFRLRLRLQVTILKQKVRKCDTAQSLAKCMVNSTNLLITSHFPF